MIFFDHFFVYLISGYVMVFIFWQVVKLYNKYVMYDITSSAIVFFHKKWYVQSHSDNIMNSLLRTFVFWP